MINTRQIVTSNHSRTFDYYFDMKTQVINAILPAITLFDSIKLLPSQTLEIVGSCFHQLDKFLRIFPRMEKAGENIILREGNTSRNYFKDRILSLRKTSDPLLIFRIWEPLFHSS